MLNVGNGWVAGGCWDDDITSDEMDHSRKFPAFSTSKSIIIIHHLPVFQGVLFRNASFFINQPMGIRHDFQHVSSANMTLAGGLGSS